MRQGAVEQIAVAGLQHRAAGEGDGDAELVRVDPRQLRDIAGDLAAIRARRHPGGDVVEDGLKLGRPDLHHGAQVRKLPIIRRPGAWLFSGWNCNPMMLSRATMAVTSPP